MVPSKVRRQAESADLHLPQSAVLTPLRAYVQFNTKIKLNKITTKLKLLQKNYCHQPSATV